MGVPYSESKADRVLRKLAQRYHQETEGYDREVCTGPIINGSIMPEGGLQRALITRNARRWNDKLCRRALRIGFSEKEWNQALNNEGDYEYVPKRKGV